MGTWGVETFENDTAADWAFEMEVADDLSPAKLAISEALEEGESYLDVDLACCALAACEVIARLQGNWGQRDAYSQPVDNWVDSHSETPDPALIESAQAVIDRIVRPPSELLELWEEEGAGEWLAAVADLRERVKAEG